MTSTSDSEDNAWIWTMPDSRPTLKTRYIQYMTGPYGHRMPGQAAPGQEADKMDPTIQDIDEIFGTMNQPMPTMPSIPTPAVSQTLAQLNATQEPYVEILEQPKAHGLRFRYKCEGRSAGSIPGENSNSEHRVYPTVKIGNMDCTSAIVVVSCVAKDGDRPHPHPHCLVGKDCQKGVCTVKIKNTHTVSFPNLGIQCATRREIKEALKLRENIRVDPFQTGFKFSTQAIDLNVVRLCFQVFLPDAQHKFTRVLTPVVSQQIYDKKAVNDLVICRLSKQAGSVRGGDEVFLLCEKVNKDDIQVRFFEIDPDNSTQARWEGYGDFGQGDVHRQFAIVFKTPAYRDLSIRSPAQVMLQLRRPSDDQVSDPKPFQFIPDDPDPDGVEGKKRKMDNLSGFFKDTGMAYGTGDNKGPVSQLVKDRIKTKATKKRTGKQAPSTVTTLPDDGSMLGAATAAAAAATAAAAPLPQYSLQNTGVQQAMQQGRAEQDSMAAYQQNFLLSNTHGQAQVSSADMMHPGMMNVGMDNINAMSMVSEPEGFNSADQRLLDSLMEPGGNNLLEFIGDQMPSNPSGSLNLPSLTDSELGLPPDLVSNIGAQAMARNDEFNPQS